MDKIICTLSTTDSASSGKLIEAAEQIDQWLLETDSDSLIRAVEFAPDDEVMSNITTHLSVVLKKGK
jgi:hypothetical protein